MKNVWLERNSVRNKIVLTIPDFCTGGAEKMVAELASAINKDKYDVTVLVIRKPLDNNIERSIPKHVNVIYLNKGYGFDLKVLVKCIHTLKKIKPDILHTHIQSFVYCVPYVIFHKVKMLHTIHNIPEEEAKGNRRRILKFLYKTGKAIPVAISDRIASMTQELYGVSKVETVYNPVDNAIFYPENQKNRKSDVVQFISVGRLVEQKNFKLLINAFSRFSEHNTNVRLTILGDGVLRAELEELIVKLGAQQKITLAGNKTDVANYLRKSDVFVLTSIFEGLPMTILEAMAVGLPIVCTDVGGNRDIVTDNGILVKNQTEDEVIRALSAMLDEQTRERCSMASIKNSVEYRLDRIARKYEQLYEEFI